MRCVRLHMDLERRFSSYEAFIMKVNLQGRAVGIIKKGLVIACGGDWYLYLSLCTQPNIE